jgi:hypothetical protein
MDQANPADQAQESQQSPRLQAPQPAPQSLRLRWFAASAAVMGWLGLALQLSVIIQSRQERGLNIAGGVFHFLSYFTIWTNLLASIVLTCAALNLRYRFAKALTAPASMTGIATCIALVGVTYHLLLRGLWHPVGTQLLANNLLHYVVPALFLIFWWLFVAPAQAGWRDAMRWTIFPALYLLFALLRGTVGNWYAYPFIDVIQLGYAQVLVNAFGVLAVFLTIAAVLIWLDRRKR